MSLADYAHWNEEAEQVWWQEVGRHGDEHEEEEWDDESWRDEDEEEHDELEG